MTTLNRTGHVRVRPESVRFKDLKSHIHCGSRRTSSNKEGAKEARLTHNSSGGDSDECGERESLLSSDVR
jgi:hypothetical protein